MGRLCSGPPTLGKSHHVLIAEILPPCDPGTPPGGVEPLSPRCGSRQPVLGHGGSLRLCEVELTPEVAIRLEHLLKSCGANA
jgi:hypothetical protein